MRLSRPSLLPVCSCLALPMSLMLLAGLAGCGPVSSVNALTVGSRATPIPLASENGTGAVPGKGTAPVQSAKPVNPIDALVIPEWIVKDFASPDVETRLRALNAWVLTAPVGSIDPLILAYGTDDDERVQARAMELIEQDWARAADRGQ